MTFDLTPDEAQLLVEHLKIYLRHLDTELSRTDRYQLQHALAREERTLESVWQRLSEAVAATTAESRASHHA
ncbi:MAG TPA: hypothetical protein VNN80_11175 [Polyangiaceae bacterium]|nr:hypothetical protein [Polyangiaceae bacterium]